VCNSPNQRQEAMAEHVGVTSIDMEAHAGGSTLSLLERPVRVGWQKARLISLLGTNSPGVAARLVLCPLAKVYPKTDSDFCLRQ
jgi:hypothetical protein